MDQLQVFEILARAQYLSAHLPHLLSRSHGVNMYSQEFQRQTSRELRLTRMPETVTL
jgi:hypothetical protein